ncbi:MAG TPA: metal ABC transporter ATP-binding protein [Thermoclostridium caenicola]|uniref:Zinc transport system ATP-binding protein n=1 Tax=Thermoclostridium caenicola TaxID=659425 RepID=A0A1M6B0S6_9FIRM|nr:metal ABC transporter ATP-binding protein [Thermoclostridium caenicola]SHI42335.1 zinc transport system ATP-binding protein [Thermoclostridium caenicola]HOK43916.1 metal ABC transporter ATP-binding protein [Thermoclostridium caenicola]HOL84580.1 metal ABC transporter ATP-binding protein [Thermoclostridium caenicola]HOP72542.1 metal ABC transporter ATP-binding protein [Thermoclostridium caenicola]HPO77247.1 metal ABC transporter ATP-binding protein [Thermoclostridium caenicola]
MNHHGINVTRACEGPNCGLCCTRIENLGVTIGSDTILSDVNLHVHCGELTAIIGPNGAGKSTLLKAILGEVRHTGSLKFLRSSGVRKERPIIGYVPQHLNLDATSPTSVLDLYAVCCSKSPAWLRIPDKVRHKAKECLSRAQADHLLDKRLGALSGGELQRVLVALALEPVPELLLLDEPVSGIDQNGLEMFYNLLSDIRKDYDLSIIMVSHDLDLVARHADRLVLLNRTVLASGTPREVMASESFRKIFAGMS